MNYKQEEIFNIEKTLQKIKNPVFIEETLSTHFAKKRAKFHPKCSIHRRNIVYTPLKKISVEKTAVVFLSLN